MSSPAYTDPRLADQPLIEVRFYERLIGEAPKTILDIGCGTGAFAVQLAD